MRKLYLFIHLMKLVVDATKFLLLLQPDFILKKHQNSFSSPKDGLATIFDDKLNMESSTENRVPVDALDLTSTRLPFHSTASSSDVDRNF